MNDEVNNWSWLTLVKPAARPSDFSSRQEWDRKRSASTFRVVLRRVDLPISIYITGENLVYRYEMDNAIVGLCSATANNNRTYFDGTCRRYTAGVREYSICDCITHNVRRYLSCLGTRQASHKYMHNNVTQFILRPMFAQNVPRPGAAVIILMANRSIHNAASAMLGCVQELHPLGIILSLLFIRQDKMTAHSGSFWTQSCISPSNSRISPFYRIKLYSKPCEVYLQL